MCVINCKLTTVTSTVPVEAREVLTNVNGEQTKQICSHYKKGICRHGKFGTRLFNGRECNFLHPKKCLKFCRFGGYQEQGCAGSCGLFHPALCRNSVNVKKCLRPDCTFTHLSGTQRREINQFQYWPGTNQQNISLQYQRKSYAQALASSRSRPSSNTFTQRTQRLLPVNYQHNFQAIPQQQNHNLQEMSIAIKNLQQSIQSLMNRPPTSLFTQADSSQQPPNNGMQTSSILTWKTYLKQ